LRWLGLILCLGCNEQNFVQLVEVNVGDNPAPQAAGPAGFSCRQDYLRPGSSTPCLSCLLFERASDLARQSLALNPDFAGTRAMGSAIVDFLSLGAGPSDSDPFVVIARCSMTPCVPILRQCFPIDLTNVRDSVDSQGPAARGALLDTIFAQLHQSSALVSADAPDQELLVRMVTTTLSCDQIAKLPMRLSQWPVDDPSTKWGAAIFGCGYAGPLRLDATHNQLFLGLPTLDPVGCVQQAAVCAADFDPRQAGALLGF
jgi:hypothetical protein